MESPESSSPIITRAVAAGLAGRYCDNYEIVGWQRTALDLIGALPQVVAQTIILASKFSPLSIRKLSPGKLTTCRIPSLLID